MIYTSVDTIPAKIFFKILETGDVTLLTDEKVEENKLIDIWNTIKNEDAELAKNPKDTKVINVSKQIEAILAKMEAVNLAVFHLKVVKDDELMQMLKDYGYRFTDNLEKDLETIERETEGLIIKLKSYQRQLQKLVPDTEETKENVPFDECVLGYSAISGLMFKPNTITQSEYRALIKIGNQKIKPLINGNPKKRHSK